MPGNQPPPNVQNYQIGGFQVILGGVDLGNVVTAELNPQDIQVVQHFTARDGERTLDDQRVVQKRLFWRFSLDEHQADLYRKYLMGKSYLDADTIHVLENPLAETNISVIYRNKLQTIWTFSHTRCITRPSAAMNFGEFNAYVRFDIEAEIMLDMAHQVDGKDAPMGVLVFT